MSQLSAAERREAGRQRRREMPAADVFAVPHDAPHEIGSFARALLARPCSGIDVFLSGATAVGPVADPGGVTLDLIDTDSALPGPFEVDVLLAALRLGALAPTSGSRSQRRDLLRDMGREVGRGYVKGVHHVAAQPLHEARGAARAASRSEARSVRTRVDLPAGATFAALAQRLVTDSPTPRLRRGRLRRLIGRDVVEAGPGADREVAQYRDTLAEDDARLLSGYRVVDMAELPGDSGVDRVVLLTGGQPGDVLVLHGRAVAPSPLEGALGVWRLGSDVQRVLQARTTLPLVPDQFLGWSTSTDGRTARAWSRLRWHHRVAITPPRSGALRSWSHAQGLVLGLVHGLTGDAHLLRGYVGGGSAVVKALGGALADQA